ncbi:MAG: MATE family efflux transporter [Williamsia sp.]|nr:MATE family efflux transporter [Williamsia sp.]
MAVTQPTRIGLFSVFSQVKKAIRGEQLDYTTGSIRKAVIMLAIPMILETALESVFAIVDIFFIGKLGNNAISAVGLTESVLSMVYAVGVGLSIGATALVSRRIGEKNEEEASRTGMQAILLSFFVAVLISAAGLIFSKPILQLMGATPGIVAAGLPYTRLIFSSGIFIVFLFLINGIFRGAGDAALAMRSLWLANICNIILCPLLIYGIGSWNGMGIVGAALATTIGRGLGVCYQMYHLLSGKGMIQFKREYFKPNKAILRSFFAISRTATLQFLIASASWTALARIMSGFGSTAVAGYTIAIRIFVFFLLPAWGLSNAAATLVGQNLGAEQPGRAEQSVWRAAKYNLIFMLFVSLVFFLGANWLSAFMTPDAEVQKIASQALKVFGFGSMFYGVGMVVISSFNGAGDTKTPTWINLFFFWALQIPLAYGLAVLLRMGPKGIFFAVITTEVLSTVTAVMIFRKGKWKLLKV